MQSNTCSVEPVVNGHLTIPRGWPLNTDSIVIMFTFYSH